MGGACVKMFIVTGFFIVVGFLEMFVYWLRLSVKFSISLCRLVVCIPHTGFCAFLCCR